MKALLLTLIFLSTPVFANSDFHVWVDGVKNQAEKEGVSASTINTAFYGITEPSEKVLSLDKSQPEKKLTFDEYKGFIVSPERISQGKAKYKKHQKFLQKLERKTGVAPQYIIALWGIETSYGANTGGFQIIPALATLAYSGRREEFFRKELIAALIVLDQGHVSPSKMTGSWAGAMGQVQFMPRSFLDLAVDGDGDGKKDIWSNEKDALASAANYLQKRDWKSGQRWGRQVRVPDNFDKNLTGREKKQKLSVWSKIGITLPNGSHIPTDTAIMAAIITPDDQNYFLVYENYDVIMDWNRSLYFATSVGLLADEIIKP